MINPLANIYNSNYKTAHTTPAFMGGPATDTETLPYGGGTYNPAGTSEITPEPVFTGAPPAAPAPAAPAASAAPANDLYAKYRDPKTGEVMSPEEYAIYMGDKVPKGTGEVPQYAGDALAKPDQSANSLIKIATNLNNSRNDIATGAKDPYGVASKSGIAYSPAELKAIESAYAGIYDPAINDAFDRLRKKQGADAKVLAREDKIFATNEAIRQWQATTGIKSSGDGTKDLFTQSQLNNGASNAGLGVDAFDSLDNDIKNFYVNPPMGLNDEEKKVPMYQVFENYFDKIEAGDIEAQEVNDFIVESTLPQPVKHYFINRLPIDPPAKERSWRNIWGLFG